MHNNRILVGIGQNDDMSSRTGATTTARSRTSRTSRTGRRKKSPLPKKLIESDESDSTDVITSDDEEDRFKDKKFTGTNNDLPPDYYSIQKLVKYVKAGNATATMMSLCFLKDYDLTTQLNQLVSALQKNSTHHSLKLLFIYQSVHS